jgi:predicted nuclease with TOPRIM domain
MAPSTRSSSIRFEQTPDGNWRVVENGTSRRLTTEELNDMFTEARHEKEALVKEKEELEAEMARKGEQYQQELQEKECTLERLAISNDGRERLSGDRDEDDGICGRAEKHTTNRAGITIKTGKFCTVKKWD